MTFEQQLILLPAFFVLAGLYTSVGHAGASGYLASMALNILVAAFTLYRFAKAGYVSWRALWPFLLGSVPLVGSTGWLHTPLDRHLLRAGRAGGSSRRHLAGFEADVNAKERRRYCFHTAGVTGSIRVPPTNSKTCFVYQ
jgi:hypothetical protein